MNIDKALQELHDQKLSVSEFRDKYRISLAVRKRKRSKKPAKSRKRAKKRTIPSAKAVQKERKQVLEVKSVPHEIKISPRYNLLTANVLPIVRSSDRKELFGVDMDKKYYIHRHEISTTRATMSRTLADDRIPVTILTGLHGTGKTFFVKLIAKEMKQNIVNVDLTTGLLGQSVKRILADNIRRKNKVCVLLDYVEHLTFKQYGNLFKFLLGLYGVIVKKGRKKYFKRHNEVPRFGSRLFIILKEYPYVYNENHIINLFKQQCDIVHLKVNSGKLRILQSYLFHEYKVSMDDEFRRHQAKNNEHVNLTKIMVNAHLSMASNNSEGKKFVDYNIVTNRSKPDYFTQCDYMMKPSLYFQNNMDYVDYVSLYIREDVLIRLVANNYLDFSFKCGSKVLWFVREFSNWLVDMDYYSKCVKLKPYWKNNKMWMLMRLYYLLTCHTNLQENKNRMSVKGLTCKSHTLDANNAQRLVNELLYCIGPLQTYYLNLRSSKLKLLSFTDYLHQYHHETKGVFVNSRFFPGFVKLQK